MHIFAYVLFEANAPMGMALEGGQLDAEGREGRGWRSEGSFVFTGWLVAAFDFVSDTALFRSES